MSRFLATELRHKPGRPPPASENRGAEAIADEEGWDEQALARVDLRRALDALSRENGRLLALRYGEDLTQPRVAEIFDLPEGTVKVRLSRLRTSTTRSTRTGMSEAGEQIEQRLAKALSHPLRMRVLTLLNQKVASPSELAEEIDEPLGNVSYHVRMLLDLDLVELVGTTPRRGAVEHHYRATEQVWVGKRGWGELPRSLRGGLSGAVLAQAWEDTLAAVEAGTFDSRASRHLSRTPMVLDSQGWDELSELLDETLERAIGIQTATAERPADGDDESLEARLILMHYQAAPGEQPSKRGGRARRAKVSQPD